MNGMKPSDDGPLTPELAAIIAALDELARAERAAAGPCVEDRLFVETRGRLTGRVPDEVRQTAAGLDALAREERLAASGTLEERIFMASRGSLPGREVREPHARGASPAGQAPGRRLLGRSIRMAASFLVAVGAFVGYLLLKQETAEKPGSRVMTLALEKQIDAGMQELSTAIQVAFTGSDTEKSTAETSSDKSDHDWFHFDEFLDKESSL